MGVALWVFVCSSAKTCNTCFTQSQVPTAPRIVLSL